MVLVMLSLYLTIHIPSASAAITSYSCPESGTHCYGINEWPGWMHGAITQISVRGIGAGNGHLQNEIWVADRNKSHSRVCIPYQGGNNGACWVEAGYEAFGTEFSPPLENTERWFWAEEKPGYHYAQYNSNPLATTPPGDGDYGYNVYVEIFLSGTDPDQVGWCPTVANEWCVDIEGNATSMVGWSVNNEMVPDSNNGEIDIGMEVVGTSGATAPNAEFIWNQFLHPITNAKEFQDQEGSGYIAQYPAVAYWPTPPVMGNQGGDFRTCTTGRC